MMIYAKDDNGMLVMAKPEDFPGIVNPLENDPVMRRAGYMPITGEPDDRAGYVAKPSTWTVRRSSEIRIEPRQAEGSRDLVDTAVEIDTSDILVTGWDYEPMPTEPDEPDEPSESSSSSEAIDFDALGDLPQVFSKWELIQAWQGCGDIDRILNSAAGKNNLLAAWASLPDQIDLRVMLTRWAAQVALYAGGGMIDQEVIERWLTWIQDNRGYDNDNSN